MTRNLSALGLALVAALAMSAVAASAAQAEKPAQLTAESSPAVMDGQQIGVQVFRRSPGGLPTTCETATFAATANNGATSVTVTPAYSKCHSTGPFGETWPVTVTMNGCDYLLHLTADFTGDVHKYTAVTDIVCQGANQIEVHTYTSAANHAAGTSLCTWKIPAQTGKQAITLTNEPAGGITPKDWIKADLNVTGVTTTRTGSALCGAEHLANGVLGGETELKGTTGVGVANGITISTD